MTVQPESIKTASDRNRYQEMQINVRKGVVNLIKSAKLKLLSDELFEGEK